MRALNQLFSDLIGLSGEAFRRVLELPAFGVAVFVVLAISVLFGLLWAWRRTRGRSGGLSKAYVLAVFSGGLLCFALLLDQKLAILQDEVRALDASLRVAAPVRSGNAPDPGQPRLFHSDQVRRSLAAHFGNVELSASALNPAMDYAALRVAGTQPVVAFVTVVDLTHPQVEIAITGQRGAKSLTSDFAKAEQCAVAINGEAGITPMPDAPLGVWTGNWIVEGRAVLLQDGPARPFLSFDAENRAHYSLASVVDRQLTPEKHNTLWGRFDLLVGGELIQHQQRRNTMRAPRTLMAVDAAGQTLFLAVVDGRQPGYSEGLSLVDAARLLRAFGATDGMACDEGGSTAMYLEARDSLVNRPSAGFERPTYTHFGVRFDAR